MREFRISFAVTVVSLLVSLAIGELSLRLLGYTPRAVARNEAFWASGIEIDDTLGWRNQEGSFRSLEPGNALMTYAAGGRRADPFSPKSDALPKAIVVGGSFTQGEGVRDDETYSHVLNRELKSVEFINYGTPGFGTYQSLLRMRDYFVGPHAKTQLVIYGLQGHHMMRNLAEGEWITALTTRDGQWLMPPHVRMSGDKMEERKGRAIPLWPLETRSAIVALAHLATVKSLNRFSTRDGKQALHNLIGQMRDAAVESGASLLVVNLFRTAPDDVERMKKATIDYLDCQHPDPFDPKLRVGGVGHPGGLMHEWWGKCIADALRKRGID